MFHNKKVGIITILKVNNYGAELQAYATQKALQLMGYDAEIIDYLFYKNKRHKSTRASRPVFTMSTRKKLEEFLYPKVSLLRHIVQRMKGGSANMDATIREQNFESFHKTNTRFSKEYRTYDELMNATMPYDVYVVGSDQVWNPGVYSSLDPYFLRFAPKNKKCLSYASSIGLGCLPEHTHEYYREAWKALDAISVREENAVELVRQISGCKATWVLDPTLLLTKYEWRMVANSNLQVPDRFVLLYELTPSPYLKQLAKHIAEVKGCNVVRITKDANRVEPDEDVVNVTTAGPAEFLSLFDMAEFVVTNSFHGTAFSINMNKDFYVVTPARKKNNSRQQSILKLFGLTDRLLIEDAPMPEKSQYAIDFTHVNIRLEVEREKSKNYLKRAIDGK